jgi:hypothetical protein
VQQLLPQGGWSDARYTTEAREVATHNRGGRKILFRIAEESAAKPSLPAA